MKVLLIMMCLPEDAPYVSYYETYFTKHLDVDIDYIIWDREHKLSRDLPINYHIYQQVSPKHTRILRKFITMLKFGKYVKSVISKNYYDRLVVFTIPTSIFISSILRKFRKRYILDIRDYSPILNLKVFRIIFQNIVLNSFSTILSSPNFNKFIPIIANTCISHNISPVLLSSILPSSYKYHIPIKILTIGQIRDYEANLALIKIFSNLTHYNLIFSGRGTTIAKLAEYSIKEKITNTVFTGSYVKDEEDSIVENCDIINSFMNDDFNSRNLLSNRLYLALRLGKPIIVNKNSLQGEIVQKYNIGIAISNPLELPDLLTKYFTKFDISKFEEGRRQFLSSIKKDSKEFTNMLDRFVS